MSESRVISSIAASTCAASASVRPAWRFSSRSRRPVRGVRSWCDASATNARCSSTIAASWAAIVAMVFANSRSSGGPETAAGSTVRSPLPKRRAVSVSRRSGSVTDRATSQPTRLIAASTTSAMTPSPPPEAVDVRVDFRGVEGEPQRAVHHAARRRPEWRRRAGRCRASPRTACPTARLPVRAVAISGRVEKSRCVGCPVSISEIPRASTTTTRAPVRVLVELAGRGSGVRPASRSSS